MSTELMTETHQSSPPWEWQLAPLQATALAADPHPRWLAVTEGRVWLTALKPEVSGEDIWLEPGQRQALPAGTAWLLEGWPQARVQLLQEAPAARRTVIG